MDEQYEQQTSAAVTLIFDELISGEKKHPGWPHDLIHAVGIITEEVGEAMRDAIDLTYWKWNAGPGKGSEAEYRASRLNDLRRELAQVGAMAIRALIHLPPVPVSGETSP